MILKSWWLILFFLICLFAYDQASRKKEREKAHLRAKLTEVTAAKEEAAALKQELESKVASFDDPAWIEMTLMRGLGLVPEGQTKVVFK